MPKLRSHPVPARLSLALAAPLVAAALGARTSPPAPEDPRLELAASWRDGSAARTAELLAHAEREPLALEVVVGEERTRQQLGGTLSVQDLRVVRSERALALEGGAPARELCFPTLERTRSTRAGESELAPPRSERSPLAGRCLRLRRADAGWAQVEGEEALPEGLELAPLAELFEAARLLPAEAPARGARWTLALADLRSLLFPSTGALGLAAPAGEADRALADAFEDSLTASLEAHYEALEQRDGRAVARVALAGELAAQASLEAPAGVRRELVERSTLQGSLLWDVEARRPLELALVRKGELQLVEQLASASSPTRRETTIRVDETRRLSWR